MIWLACGAIYFGVGLWLGLSRMDIGRCIISATILVAGGGMMFVSAADLISFIMIFAPVIGFAVALGRTFRQMRARK